MKIHNNFQPVTIQSKNSFAASLQPDRTPNTVMPEDLPCKDLILCRGLPGSGKSEIARGLTEFGYLHFEADMFFEVDGVYRYDARCIQEAHDWCKRKTREALGRGANVVVSNTFTRLQEMAPYYEMGAKAVRVIEATGRWESVHRLSRESFARMQARWERLPSSMPALQVTASLCDSAVGVRFVSANDDGGWQDVKAG